MLTLEVNRVRIFFILALCLLHINSNGQKIEDIKSLELKFKTADSILLISHKATIEYGGKIVPDWDINDTSMNLKKWYKLNPPKPPFLINGRINKKIVIERYKLTNQDKEGINNIFLRQVNLDTVQMIKCDQPAHSILLYHDKKLSYIDICFGCKKIHTSNNINLDESNFDDQKWNELKYYFKSKGLEKLLTYLEE